jgi:hypothetical protein
VSRPAKILTCECGVCNAEITGPAWRINYRLKCSPVLFCSQACSGEAKRKPGWKPSIPRIPPAAITRKCDNCDVEFSRTEAEIRQRVKISDKLFCGVSCSLFYRNNPEPGMKPPVGSTRYRDWARYLYTIGLGMNRGISSRLSYGPQKANRQTCRQHCRQRTVNPN